MAKKKKPTEMELYELVRRDWNGVNPVTKIVPSKKEKENHQTQEKRNGASDCRQCVTRSITEPMTQTTGK